MKTALRMARWTVALASIEVALAATSPIDPCKNHYILREPRECILPTRDFPIGAPGAVAVDTAGNVYFSSPNIVFRLDASGALVRVAGNGTPGYSGDGGPATEALLSFPESYPEMIRDPIDFLELLGPLALDAAGNLYIGDAYNNRVRRVDASGVIVTVIGDGALAWSGLGGPMHLLWPQGVAVDTGGNLFVADGSGRLRKVSPDGAVTTLTIDDCGKPIAPGLCGPEGISVDGRGNVIVADGYCRIRKVSGNGEVVTIAGADTLFDPRGFTFTCGYSGDGGPATSAALESPFGVAVDADGNVFIADTYNNCIRKVDGAGIITTVAGRCDFEMRGYSGDGGPANEALLNRPHGVAVDAAGNLFIADTQNRRMRKVTTNGVIVTIAGNGESLPQ